MNYNISRLSSGGIIAAYRCTAACGHCLYGCSPKAESGYISEETAARICERLRGLGCPGLHIGGGEPFLDPEALVKLIKVINENGMSVDYIETNAAWISRDDARNHRILSEVLEAGGECIMVSADPFHIEFIPFWKVEALIRLFKEMSIPHFIWKERYLAPLRKLDPEKTYDAGALRDALGYDVTDQCALEYGMGFNGRALNLLREFGQKRPASAFSGFCPELRGTGHFHVDFLGRYVPPGCTGMGIRIEDIGEELDPAEYPVISRLLDGGMGGLLQYACENGFAPDPEGYFSKCELCFMIRKFLINKNRQAYPDLSPESFYREDF